MWHPPCWGDPFPLVPELRGEEKTLSFRLTFWLESKDQHGQQVLKPIFSRTGVLAHIYPGSFPIAFSLIQLSITTVDDLNFRKITKMCQKRFIVSIGIPWMPLASTHILIYSILTKTRCPHKRGDLTHWTGSWPGRRFWLYIFSVEGNQMGFF